MKAILVTVFFFSGFLANAQSYKLEGNEVKIDREVVFKPATSTLKPESDSALMIIKKYLEDKSYISLLRVECHTDNLGDVAKSQQLSQDRALAVCTRLVKLGVDCKRLIAVGFGGTKPIADNSTAEGKMQNRRVTFVNAALRGHAIGGLPTDGGGQVAGDPCKE